MTGNCSGYADLEFAFPLTVLETRSDSTHGTRYRIDFAYARSMPPIPVCYDLGHCSGYSNPALAMSGMQ